MKQSVQTFFASALGAVFGMAFVAAFMLIVVPTIAFLVLSGNRHSAVESIEAHSILNIDLMGQIVERRRPFSFDFVGDHSLFAEDRVLGLFELNKAIALAKTDKRIDGIYLHIGDFSAGWATVNSLRRSLKDFSASGKWVYVYAERLNEMGYYLATAGNQIFMQPAGDFEFNGLAAEGTFVKGLLDKLELEPQVFRVGRFKAAIEPLLLEKMSPENRAQSQELVGDMWKQVRDAAAELTKIAPEQLDRMAANLEVVSAEKAKEAGLIHELAYEDVVEDRMRAFTVGADNELELVRPGQLLRDSGESSRRSGNKKIAVIFAEGEIHSGLGQPDSIGSRTFHEDLQDAVADEDVAAIVVRVNSPGGDALASDVIWRDLRSVDEEIPVVVSMGDVAASGGYYMAAAGRFIFAEPSTLTGSIGVFGVVFNTSKFFKSKAGVTFDRALTHPHADLGTMSRAIEPMEVKVVQGEVERIYKRFIDVVQESRGYEQRKDLEEIAEGRVWSGARAKELGLVDELGGLSQAIVKAAEFAGITEYGIETYPANVDPFRHLFERLSEDMSSRLFERTRLTERIHEFRSIFEDPKNTVSARLLFSYKIQ